MDSFQIRNHRRQTLRCSLRVSYCASSNKTLYAFFSSVKIVFRFDSTRMRQVVDSHVGGWVTSKGGFTHEFYFFL